MLGPFWKILGKQSKRRQEKLLALMQLTFYNSNSRREFRFVRFMECSHCRVVELSSVNCILIKLKLCLDWHTF